MKRAFFAALCLSIASVTASHAATVNWAQTATATASSEYIPTGTADRAIDGKIETIWNAGSHTSKKNPHFIELDLGESRVIGSIQGVVSQSPSGRVVHKVYLDDVLSFTWDKDTYNEDVLTYNFKNFKDARFVRIETISSPSWVAWAELRVFNEPAPVPVPASAVLLLSALSGFGLMKRRQRKIA